MNGKASNKILATFFISEEDGKKEDASAYWKPINFDIYDQLLPQLIQEAIDQWIDENDITHHVIYEVIFTHVIERDGAGTVFCEYFKPVYVSSELI